MSQCPTCGSNVSENAEVCQDCGMDLQNAHTVSPTETSAPLPHTDLEAGTAHSVDADATLPVDTGAAPSIETPDASPSSTATPFIPPTPSETTTPSEAAIPSGTAAPSTAPPSGTAFPAGTQARLELRRGGVPTGDQFPFAGRVVIGRFDPDSGPVDIDLGPLPESAYISRRHAEIWSDSGQWKIKDLGSRNGTFIQPPGGGGFQRVADDQSLNDGDEIALGNARFTFHAG